MILPDILAPNLRVVFCGSAVGAKSAEAGSYYAGPGNKFYPILYKSGITPTLFHPNDFRKLLNYSIGLTDIVKIKSGNDNILSYSDFDIIGFKEKITLYDPQYVCFNGKASAAAILFNNFKYTKLVDFGLLSRRIGNTKLYVAPSTSGNANGFWNESYWFQLKELISE